MTTGGYFFVLSYSCCPARVVYGGDGQDKCYLTVFAGLVGAGTGILKCLIGFQVSILLTVVTRLIFRSHDCPCLTLSQDGT